MFLGLVCIAIVILVVLVVFVILVVVLLVVLVFARFARVFVVLGVDVVIVVACGGCVVVMGDAGDCFCSTLTEMSSVLIDIQFIAMSIDCYTLLVSNKAIILPLLLLLSWGE